MLDRAYKEFFGSPNYCFTLEGDAPKGVPLLKLHGSFGWKRQKIRKQRRTVEIIPLGSNKNYLHAPYGFIWNRALEVLVECDILRVVGCSLSQNDFHLVDLLFKAHLERATAFEMEIISSDHTGRTIKDSYGFFPKITTLVDVEKHLIPETNPENPFKTWLKYKSIAMLQEEIEGTRYLRKVAR